MLAGTLGILWAAGKLRVLASGEVDLADPDVLARVVELLSEFSPEERADIGVKAVAMGAEQAVITALLNLVGGEVIVVTDKAPKFPWPWVIGGALVAATAGGVVAHRSYRKRRALRSA